MMIIYSKKQLMRIVGMSFDLPTLGIVSWYLKEHSDLYCEETIKEVRKFILDKTTFVKWSKRF